MATRAGSRRITRDELAALQDALVRLGRLHTISQQPASPARDCKIQTWLSGLRADLAGILRCIEAAPPRPEPSPATAVDPDSGIDLAEARRQLDMPAELPLGDETPVCHTYTWSMCDSLGVTHRPG